MNQVQHNKLVSFPWDLLLMTTRLQADIDFLKEYKQRHIANVAIGK